MKNLVQEGLKRFENLNIIDLEKEEKKRNDANEKIKSLRVNSAQDDDDPDKPGTSKSKETVAELSEKERKKQEMLKVGKEMINCYFKHLITNFCEFRSRL